METRSKLIKITLYTLLLSVAIGFAAVIYLKSTTKAKKNTPLNLPIEYIKFDKEIANCKERNLANKILLITSRYCPHCKETIKTLTPLITQCGLTNNFQILDVINKDDAQILDNLAIRISGVPVLIINCKAYLGTKETKQYQDLLLKFCNNTITDHN